MTPIDEALKMLEQLGIGLFGVTAVFLSQSSCAGTRRYACLFGLASQPFWFLASYKAQQWGIFGLSILYAASWLKGFYCNWIRGWVE
jgi:hypothetical protein